MKPRLKLEPRQKSTLSTRRLIINTTLSIAVAGLITWITTLFLNVGHPEAAFAGGSFSTARSGSWILGSTWTGGTAPTTSGLDGVTVTINAGHTVTLSSDLTVKNDVTIIVNAGAKLVISGDFTAQNNLTLIISGELDISGTFNAVNNTSITINNGGKMNVYGAISMKNDAVVQVNGTLTGGDNLTFKNSPSFTGTGTVAVVGASCSGWSGPGSCTDNRTLPIELISFTAASTEDGVLLVWKTATESNNDHFTIERSADGVTYEELTQVQGSGTTSKITEYEYTDNEPLSGISYYRLSQTDFDGKSETFKPVSVQVEASEKTGISVYPNPITESTLHVKFGKPEKGIVQLIDGRGNSILSEQVDGFSEELELAINSELKPGIYYLNYKSATSQETVKLMK